MLETWTEADLGVLTCPACGREGNSYGHRPDQTLEAATEPGTILTCTRCWTSLVIVPDGVRAATSEDIAAYNARCG